MYIGEKVDFAYTGGIQEFVAPEKGLYLLEAWGARGGYGYDTPMAGQGGYSKGYVVLDKNERIYIVVGNVGANIAGNGQSNRAAAGGFNGGGNGYGGRSGDYGGGGGGATHFARSGDLLANTPLEDVFIIAGGGGGGYRNSGTWLYGGHGGGLTSTGGLMYDAKNRLAAATQTSGYAYGQGGIDGQKYGGGGGGGGLYGGVGSVYCAGSGGSGYIDGAKALTYKGVEYVPETTTGGNGAAGKASITYIAKGFREIYFHGILLDAIIVNGVELDDIRFPEDIASVAKVTYYYGETVLRTRYIDEGADALHTDIVMPEQEGYTFVGWTLQPESIDIVNELNAGVTPINLYAVYLPNTYDIYVAGSTHDERFTSGSYRTAATANWNSTSDTSNFNVNFKSYQNGNINCYVNMSGGGFGQYFINGTGTVIYGGTTYIENINAGIRDGNNTIGVDAYASEAQTLNVSMTIRRITLSNPKPWV